MKPKQIYLLKDGTQVPGITTVLASLGWKTDGIKWWAWKLGKKGINLMDASKEATDAGTIAHYLIECDIKRMKPDIDKEFAVIESREETLKKADMAYFNFREWKKMVNFRGYLTEQVCISEKYKFGTRIDCLGFIRDKLSVLDWKAASGIYEDHLIQLAASKHIWEENNPKKLLDGGCHLLKIDKEEASFSYKFWADLPIEWDTFIHLLAIHYNRAAIKRNTR